MEPTECVIIIISRVFLSQVYRREIFARTSSTRGVIRFVFSRPCRRGGENKLDVEKEREREREHQNKRNKPQHINSKTHNIFPDSK